MTGDVANVRIRRGTFQFNPQPDGEILVDANFVADGLDCRMTGRATIVGLRVFVIFDATTREGGSWSGKATFDRAAANQLAGRLQVKAGDDAPVHLRKLGS